MIEMASLNRRRAVVNGFRVRIACDNEVLYTFIRNELVIMNYRLVA